MNKTRRGSIVRAYVDKLKEISLANGYLTDLGGHAYTRLKFFDEINEWPCVCVTAGTETIQHQGGGYKDRFLTLNLTAYVNHEDSLEKLEELLEDIEKVTDNNGRLAYTDSQGNSSNTLDITISFIDTDQGALAPLGVGEMTLQVRL